jgi:hypothetical protein
MKRWTDVRDDDAGPVIPGQARRTEVAPTERIAFGGRSHRLKEIGGPADAATPGAALVRGNTGRGQDPDRTTNCDDLAASANLRWIRSRPRPICPRRSRTRAAAWWAPCSSCEAWPPLRPAGEAGSRFCENDRFSAGTLLPPRLAISRRLFGSIEADPRRAVLMFRSPSDVGWAAENRNQRRWFKRGPRV